METKIGLQRHTKLGRILAVRTICTDRAGRIRPSGPVVTSRVKKLRLDQLLISGVHQIWLI